jgi:predicted protein tyrosine phosphatase
MTKVLFVCSQNRLRSATAERVFSGRAGLDVRSAGTDHDARVPVSGDLVSWADVILVMENRHRNIIRRKFGAACAGKRLVTLHIPDEYDFMDPALVQILEDAVGPHLPRMPHAGDDE